MIDHLDRESETHAVCNDVNKVLARSQNILADLKNSEEYEVLISRSNEIAGSLDLLIHNAFIITR